MPILSLRASNKLTKFFLASKLIFFNVIQNKKYYEIIEQTSREPK